MQPAPTFSKRQFLFRHKSFRWLLLMTLSLVTFVLIFIGGLKPPAAPAVDVTTGQLEATSNWKHASFPVENFVAYSSPFGYRSSPTSGSREFHRGLDLAAPEGSYIRNWWSGEVVDLSDNTACGTMIAIRSGPWTHLYCHLKGSVEGSGSDRYLMDSEGGIAIALLQQIPTGARIGRVGMTGRTTGPHLHWGLKYGETYIDPAQVLQEMHKYQARS